ncbi:MAG: hypothetical protein ACOZCO_15535 [Bacteroidota bacterium]
MKTILKTAVFCSFLWMTANAYSQATFVAKTGDDELDVTLTELNVSASVDLDAFKIDMVRTYGVLETHVDNLFVNFGMTAGDVFMTLEIAKQVKKPITDVAECFKKNNGKGWGVIAKEMGIKPGSAEFKALKVSAKEKKTKAKAKESQKKNNAKPVDKGKVKTK